MITLKYNGEIEDFAITQFLIDNATTLKKEVLIQIEKALKLNTNSIYVAEIIINNDSENTIDFYLEKANWKSFLNAIKVSLLKDEEYELLAKMKNILSEL